MTNEERLARVRLSPDGLDVGAQGLGCMGTSEFYGTTDEAAARATLRVGIVPYSPSGRGFLTGALPTQFHAGDVRTAQASGDRYPEVQDTAAARES